MSYDVTVMFGARGSITLERATVLLCRITGIPFAPSGKRPELEASGFGVRFDLHGRFGFVKSIESEPVEDLDWQLDLNAKSSSGIIHPLGFWLAERLSLETSGRTVVGLNAVELHAATFERGQPRVQKAEALHRVSPVGWHLGSGK
ncbi:MAG: hypothetical protein JST54_17595 [Deltaproteobacteria bacterium]|nr:hypothetical protein [Deltaproteobacteria bacterium]